MKKQGLYKLFFLALAAGIMLTGVTSCKKYNEWPVDESFNQLFRPSALVATVNGVSVSLKWKAKPNTNSYVIELSKDSLLFTTIDKTYNLAGKDVLKDGDGNSTFSVPDLLDPSTQYSVRVRGVDTTSTTAGSDWIGVAFLTKTEQIMNSILPDDITKNSVVLTWTIPNQVSHLMLGDVRYDITPEEKLEGKKTIENLTPVTVYTVTLYFNNSIRGSQTFATPPDLPTGSDVVYVKATDNLASMIEAATANTRFVVLEGTKYDANYDDTGNPKVINIPSNIDISIIGQASANKKAIISFNGFNLPAFAGTIHFENVELTGYAKGDASTSKRAYIFNQSVGSTTAGISFENCIIHHFTNAVVRVQGTNQITINNISANNCIVDDIGVGTSYYFVTNTVATSKINNINVTNSTFSNMNGFIAHSAAPSLSVKVEDNTFYNAIASSRYLVDYNVQTISNGFSFKNNIVDKTTGKGIRSGTLATGSNNYTTTDVVFGGNAIPSSILASPNYAKAGNDLFTSPTTGDFLIKDTDFAGKATAGDPRWRIQ